MRPSISSQPMPSTKMLRHSRSQPGDMMKARSGSCARSAGSRKASMQLCAARRRPPRASSMASMSGWQAP